MALLSRTHWFIGYVPRCLYFAVADVTDEYLDAYHSIDSSVEILLRSLRDNPAQAATDDDDDDYEDEDYYDDYYDDEDEDVDDDEDDADADDESDEDRYIYDKFEDDEDDSSEEEEDESILDADVDRDVESKAANQEHYGDQGVCHAYYTDCEINICHYSA